MQCMQSRPEAGMQNQFHFPDRTSPPPTASANVLHHACLATPPLFCSPLVAPPTLECPRWTCWGAKGEPSHSTREDCRCRGLGDGLVFSSFCQSPGVTCAGGSCLGCSWCFVFQSLQLSSWTASAYTRAASAAAAAAAAAVASACSLQCADRSFPPRPEYNGQVSFLRFSCLRPRGLESRGTH